ncbi:MAG: thioredoxin-disulfide reductase [Phycisphaerae bacterium]|nr:thioredoxin-disulfide reductase [Phycisphaerae bacterium]MCZ2400998.1 thioredoxin-disulfide reductase [Phycisphaerae bacterium]NUQ49400.1 thioredoxin-disulfide reductase [Phycisphaerae bacterium]
MADQVEKVVIIGSGPAGLTACIYAARAALQPLCFEGYNAGGLIPGGQLMFTTEVENYPGFPDGVDGPKMMKAFRKQAERFGTRLITQDVYEVDFRNRPFTIKSDDHTVRAHAVIVATGARANWLGLPNEKRLAESGGGVSACAVCDGALPAFRNQDLVVVGGGDSAIEEGSYLTKFARKVYLVHRRDQLRASKAMQERFFKLVEHGKMEPVWNATIVDVLGEQTISGVRLKDVRTGEQRDLPCRGLFLAIGHTPNTELFKGVLDTDDKGYLKLPNPPGTRTNVEGVFAAGDVADHVYRQAVTAAGTGCMAAIDAERWLAGRGIE